MSKINMITLGYSIQIINARGTQVTFWVIPFVSEMLGGTQVTILVIPFVSEMLRVTKVTVWVIPFMSEKLGGTQVTFWATVIPPNTHRSIAINYMALPLACIIKFYLKL